MASRYSQVSGVGESRKQKMASNNGSIKFVYYIVSLLITVALSVGMVLTSYFKGKIETEAKFNAIIMQQATDKLDIVKRIDLLEENLGNRIDWTSRSIEILAREVPRAIEKHELKMHTKAAMSSASPTKITISLPKKPVEAKK